MKNLNSVMSFFKGVKRSRHRASNLNGPVSDQVSFSILLWLGGFFNDTGHSPLFSEREFTNKLQASWPAALTSTQCRRGCAAWSSRRVHHWGLSQDYWKNLCTQNKETHVHKITNVPVFCPCLVKCHVYILCFNMWFRRTVAWEVFDPAFLSRTIN